ncbi:hypothetical protein OIO90_003247 [Microbotryomycetes sp. JL221]|nr:hypothetical protein OIO90_003247 [Microbotryomycetes sp. JL221]
MSARTNGGGGGSSARARATSSRSSTPVTSTRLYIGNLSSSVDEYSLMQLCSRQGKITKLDFLFHKTGPLKGKPRGYAFVEFATVQEAQQAKLNLHDKLVRGKKINVTQASEQQFNDDQRLGSSTGSKSFHHHHHSNNEPMRPTTISLLKGQGVSNASTDRKIAALEAKLASIRQTKPVETTTTTTTTGLDNVSSTLLEQDLKSGSSTPTINNKHDMLDSSSNLNTEPSTTTSTTKTNQNQIDPDQIDQQSTDKDDNNKKQIIVDRVKAGLPLKPTFKVDLPPNPL